MAAALDQRFQMESPDEAKGIDAVRRYIAWKCGTRCRSNAIGYTGTRAGPDRRSVKLDTEHGLECRAIDQAAFRRHEAGANPGGKGEQARSHGRAPPRAADRRARPRDHRAQSSGGERLSRLLESPAGWARLRDHRQPERQERDRRGRSPDQDRPNSRIRTEYARGGSLPPHARGHGMVVRGRSFLPVSSGPGRRTPVGT